MGAVIGIPEEQVQAVLNQVSEEDGENLYIANYNGPGQLVVTGARNSVKKACKILKDMGQACACASTERSRSFA